MKMLNGFTGYKEFFPLGTECVKSGDFVDMNEYV